jgi:hypothetical protein
MTPTWFLLYDKPATVDAWADPPTYVGRTESPQKARAHLERIQANPYMSGYVTIITDGQVRHAQTVGGLIDGTRDEAVTVDLTRHQ